MQRHHARIGALFVGGGKPESEHDGAGQRDDGERAEHADGLS